MALIQTVRGLSPVIEESVYLAPNATLIGDLHIGESASIWHNVVIRADVNAIRVGARTNIQDNTVIHATYLTQATYIAEDVTIGHQCILHGCTIGAGSLIGMGSIIMDGVVIGENSIVGAGSLIPEGKTFPPGSLILGRPGVFKRPLTDKELQFLKQSVQNYLLYKTWYEGDDQ